MPISWGGGGMSTVSLEDHGYSEGDTVPQKMGEDAGTRIGEGC